MDPPEKDSKPTLENTQKLDMADPPDRRPSRGHAHLYLLEEIDKYLGPWGNDGYPLGYGKKYNILFTTDPLLMTHTNVQNWVWKTAH